MPLAVAIITANVFVILHLALSIFPFFFGCYTLAFLPFSVFFASLFLDPLLTDVFYATVTKDTELFLHSVSPWFIISAEGVLFCLCFFLMGITPLLWAVWMWSLTHLVHLGV